MDNVEAVLQYGALGLLAIMIIGVGYYIHSIETRAAAREEASIERQRQLDIEARERADAREKAAHEIQDKTIDMMIQLTKALAELTSEVSEHRRESASDHVNIMALCEKFSKRGIRE
jgi:hypothetical protein